MIKMMMHGCNGKMGRMITEIVRGDDNAVIAAGVDTYTEAPNDYPVFDSIEKCDVDVDVVIDFSTAKAVDGLWTTVRKRGFRLYSARRGFRRSSLRKWLRRQRRSRS